jgi:hypothetical protein
MAEPATFTTTLKLVMWALALFALLWLTIDTNRFHVASPASSFNSTVSTSQPATSSTSG